MRKLTPISKTEAESILAAQKLSKQFEELKASIPLPKNGRDGRDGKDGVTTTVVKEVLANKEALLDKEEFEEFKNYMVRMEQDIRDSLAQTHGYFGGGGSPDLANDIPWWILSNEEEVLEDREIAVIADVLQLDGTLELKGAAKLALI